MVGYTAGGVPSTHQTCIGIVQVRENGGVHLAHRCRRAQRADCTMEPTINGQGNIRSVVQCGNQVGHATPVGCIKNLRCIKNQTKLHGHTAHEGALDILQVAVHLRGIGHEVGIRHASPHLQPKIDAKNGKYQPYGGPADLEGQTALYGFAELGIHHGPEFASASHDNSRLCLEATLRLLPCDHVALVQRDHGREHDEHADPVEDKNHDKTKVKGEKAGKICASGRSNGECRDGCQGCCSCCNAPAGKSSHHDFFHVLHVRAHGVHGGDQQKDDINANSQTQERHHGP
mmetsp:Transcript_17570/g.41273  ORF Transcript_17570/g.41273 Transcript_17570/m.41273 type:complete len:288 (+) Transcript_17570:1015-1878(+)